MEIEHFVRRENLLRLRKLLSQTTDEETRQQIKKLLAEEKAKEGGVSRQG